MRQTLSHPLLQEVLKTASAFKIELTLNPLKTLLAITTPTALLLVLLPRASSLSSASSSSISVKAEKIGSFYHNQHTPRVESISCTRWHPWSKRGTSLLVLLRNGTFYEYDVASDLKEPQQTLSLLPSSSKSASPKLGFGGAKTQADSEDEEEDEQTVSFTLGMVDDVAPASRSQDPLDWAPLTIYVLTKGGDIWAAAPFLPQYARVPFSYLQALSAYVKLNDGEPGVQETTRQREYALRFVSSLLKQARLYQSAPPPQERGARASTPARVLARDADQLKSSPSTRRSQAGNRSMSLDPETTFLGEDDADDGTEEDEELDLVEVKAPRSPIVPATIMPQGPFLLAPAPHEIDETRASQGVELMYNRATDLELLLLLADDGKLDVGVLSISGKVQAKWAASEKDGLAQKQRRSSLKRSKKSGRFALDEGSSDEEGGDGSREVPKPGDDGACSSLPTLFVYETLNLGLPGRQASARNPRLVKNPVYPDEVYVHHAFGAHMISMLPWARTLSELLEKQDQEELARFLGSNKGSDAQWIIKIADVTDQRAGRSEREGVSKIEVVDDIYLGYSLLVQLGDGECFGIELSLRPSSESSDTQTEQTLDGDASALDARGKPRYTSLLGNEPFVPPTPFQNPSSSAFPATQFKTTTSSSKAELQVTPETLRWLGTTVRDLRGKIREIVQGGNTIQSHLQLQIKELHRQVGKLNEIRRRIDQHGTAKIEDSAGPSGGLSQRIDRISSRQQALISRVDQVLQRSMDASNMGAVSEHEAAWLKEMTHMERNVGKEANEGLIGRVSKLQAQLDSLKPDLESLQGKLDERERESSSHLGSKQMERILQALAVESARLSEAKEKAQHLNRKVGRQQGGR